MDFTASIAPIKLAVTFRIAKATKLTITGWGVFEAAGKKIVVKLYYCSIVRYSYKCDIAELVTYSNGTKDYKPQKSSKMLRATHTRQW